MPQGKGTYGSKVGRPRKYTGLKEHARLQNSNLGDLSANLRPRQRSQRELAEVKKKDALAAQAKKPFDPGRSAVAESFKTPLESPKTGFNLDSDLKRKLKQRALKQRR